MRTVAICSTSLLAETAVDTSYLTVCYTYFQKDITRFLQVQKIFQTFCAIDRKVRIFLFLFDRYDSSIFGILSVRTVSKLAVKNVVFIA